MPTPHPRRSHHLPVRSARRRCRSPAPAPESDRDRLPRALRASDRCPVRRPVFAARQPAGAGVGGAADADWPRSPRPPTAVRRRRAGHQSRRTANATTTRCRSTTPTERGTRSPPGRPSSSSESRCCCSPVSTTLGCRRGSPPGMPVSSSVPDCWCNPAPGTSLVRRFRVVHADAGGRSRLTASSSIVAATVTPSVRIVPVARARVSGVRVVSSGRPGDGVELHGQLGHAPDRVRRQRRPHHRAHRRGDRHQRHANTGQQMAGECGDEHDRPGQVAGRGGEGVRFAAASA
jgi:hypothetical protein